MLPLGEYRYLTYARCIRINVFPIAFFRVIKFFLDIADHGHYRIGRKFYNHRMS
jgi:hypothetical protein